MGPSGPFLLPIKIPIQKIKNKNLHEKGHLLELSEVLIALSICSVTNPMVENAINHLPDINQMKSIYSDEAFFSKIDVNTENLVALLVENYKKIRNKYYL